MVATTFKSLSMNLASEGGMGLVYLAEQQEPVKRRVALKIVKLGMDAKQVLARFEAELQTSFYMRTFSLFASQNPAIS